MLPPATKCTLVEMPIIILDARALTDAQVINMEHSLFTNQLTSGGYVYTLYVTDTIALAGVYNETTIYTAIRGNALMQIEGLTKVGYCTLPISLTTVLISGVLLAAPLI